jgi:hypothetical protein
MNTPRWLSVAFVMTAIVSTATGCASRRAAVDEGPQPAAFARDVADSDGRFPYGPAPVIHGPVPVQPKK